MSPIVFLDFNTRDSFEEKQRGFSDRHYLRISARLFVKKERSSISSVQDTLGLCVEFDQPGRNQLQIGLCKGGCWGGFPTIRIDRREFLYLVRIKRIPISIMEESSSLSRLATTFTFFSPTALIDPSTHISVLNDT